MVKKAKKVKGVEEALASAIKWGPNYKEGLELAEDLARTKLSEDWMVWTQIPLGPVAGYAGASPRADVLAARKSFSDPRFVIYEVKVSRSDFLGDVNRGKYRSYFPFCSQLYFACPVGLIKGHEAPEDCGLITRGDHGWHVVKAATRREFKPDLDLLIKLLITGYQDHFQRWKQYERLHLLEYHGLKAAARDHGIKVAQDLSTGQEIMSEAKKLVADIGQVLGKEYLTLDSAVWHLKADIEMLLQHRRYITEALDLADLTLLLFQGRRFFANEVPERLRKIARRLDDQFAKEERTK